MCGHVCSASSTSRVMEQYKVSSAALRVQPVVPTQQEVHSCGWVWARSIVDRKLTCCVQFDPSQVNLTTRRSAHMWKTNSYSLHYSIALNYSPHVEACVYLLLGKGGSHQTMPLTHHICNTMCSAKRLRQIKAVR